MPLSNPNCTRSPIDRDRRVHVFFKLYFGLVNPRVTAFFFLPSDFILFYLDVGLLYVYVFFENLGIRINICVRKFGN